jgi:hypothetical protein
MLKFFKFNIDGTILRFVKCCLNGVEELHILSEFKCCQRVRKGSIQTTRACLCLNEVKLIFGTTGFLSLDTIETGFAITYKNKIYASIEEPVLYA